MITQQTELRNNILYFAIAKFQIRMVFVVKQLTQSTKTTLDLRHSHTDMESGVSRLDIQ